MGMGVTVSCFATNTAKSVVDLVFADKDGCCITQTDDFDQKIGCSLNCGVIKLIADLICGGLEIGKVADTFRNQNCNSDADCNDDGMSPYVCNTKRGTCERVMPIK